MKGWTALALAQLMSCAGEPRRDALVVTLQPSASASEPTAPAATSARRAMEHDTPPIEIRPTALSVALDAQGRVRVNGDTVPDFAAVTDEAREHLHRFQGDDAAATANVMADRAAPYSEIVRLMDALREGGVHSFNFSVAP